MSSEQRAEGQDALRYRFWRDWWLSDEDEGLLPAALMHAKTADEVDAAIDQILKRGTAT